MSSISLLATKEFAKKIEALGADYPDAPVSGGEVAPRPRASPSWAAAREHLQQVRSRCSTGMGKNVTLVGDNGDGQTTKVANQIIVALNIEAVSEFAAVRASKAGADPALVRQALMGGLPARGFSKCMANAWSSAPLPGLPPPSSCTPRRT